MHKKSAFTLVELIVVITILAILGTIAFLSFSGYSSSARDSTRVSDLASIAKTLDVYQVNTGKYPLPDNYLTTTYSGGIVWYQGTVGLGVFTKMTGVARGGISAKPTDPVSGKEYRYASLEYSRHYQLQTELESTLSYYPSTIIDTAYADTVTPGYTYIKGNYNGLVARTQTGNTIYLVATPSILTSSGSSGSILDITTLSGTFLYNNQPTDSGIAFTPVHVFSGTSLPVDDTSSGITNLVTAIQQVYTGSQIPANDISSIFTITGSSTIPSGCGILSGVGGKCGGALVSVDNGGAVGGGEPPVVIPVADFYVSTNSASGDDAGVCDVITPCKTIGGALVKAISNKSIYVFSGTYTEQLTFTNAKTSITIIGENPLNTKITYSSATVPTILFTAANTITLRGFTIEQTSSFYVVNAASTPQNITLDGNRIISASTGYPAVNIANGTNFMITNNYFQGGERSVSVTGTNHLIAYNDIYGGVNMGIYINGGNGLTILGNLIRKTAQGIYVGTGPNVSINNNTIVATTNRAIYISSVAALGSLKNNIIAYNHEEGIESATPLTSTYNTFFANGNGNVNYVLGTDDNENDPKFADGGYRLTSDSPCVNTGLGDASSQGGKDLSILTTQNNGSLDGGVVDRGAHLPATVLVPQILYVNTAGDDANPGTVASPLRTIATAIAQAKTRAKIYVSPGTYSEQLSFTHTQAGVQLLAIDPDPVNTKITYSSTTVPTILFTTASSVTLRGFTIEQTSSFYVINAASTPYNITLDGNRIISSSAGYPSVYIANGTNFVVTNNYFQGGERTLSITGKNHLIAHNDIYGAVNMGIYINGGNGLTILDNIIRNTAQGIYAGTGPNISIINNTVVATTNRAIYVSSPAAISSIKNNIIANNTKGIDAASVFSAGSYNTFYNNTTGNGVNYSLGTNDIIQDPKFTTSGSRSYYLASDSPCLDAGDNTSDSYGLNNFTTQTSSSLDGGTVDRGAHYPPTPVTY